MIITPYNGFTRPANTTAYADTDLVADNVTAGSVLPLRFGVSKLAHGNGRIIGARILKSTTTSTAASFKVHLFALSPTVTNGDNGTFAVATADTYIGEIALDMSSGSFTYGGGLWKSNRLTAALSFDLELNTDAGRVIYGLVEAKGAYAPGSAETFKLWLEIEDDQG